MKVIACLIALSACSSLTVKNFTACAIAPGQSGVVCDQFLVNHQVVLDEQEWRAIQPGWIAVSPEDFGNLKVEIEQACSELNCSYEQTQAIRSFFEKFTF